MAIDRHLVRGLGAYPTAECYDPNRSSWVPYWINTSTEANCVLMKLFGAYPGVDYKTPYPEPPPPVAPGVPPAGNVSPEEAQRIQDQLIAESDVATKTRLQLFYEDLAADIDARTKDCSWYQNKGSDNACHFGSTMLWIVAAAGVATAVYLKR